MFYGDKHFNMKEFMAEAEKWAEDAKQCECCKVWAILDENGRCSYCWPEGHIHVRI